MSNGSIKDYTPRFKFIIPQFNIATWHDYIESNFRNIDALFFNLFDINQYKGQWTNLTLYNVGDVVFVGEDKLNGEQTIYEGRLVKVLVEHTTDDSEYFSKYLEKHPDYYELFADASTAQYYAQQVKQALEDAQTIVDQAEESVTNSQQAATNAQNYAQSAQNSKNLAETAATNAQSSEQSAETYYNYLVNNKPVQYSLTCLSSEWISDNTYQDLGLNYKYTKTIEKSLENAAVYCVFDTKDALSGNFGPTVEINGNNISIFAKEKPTENVNIKIFITYAEEN